MKPKYSIGEVVRIKATGEKVKIDKVYKDCKEGRLYFTDDYYCYYESELKPYRPSRTGKYRNERGQFVSKKLYVGCDFGSHSADAIAYYLDRVEKERKEDSKQRNYQKILGELICIRAKQDEIEKKIDELGRRV